MAGIEPMTVTELRRLWRRRWFEPLEERGVRLRKAYLRAYLPVGAWLLTADQLQDKLDHEKAARP